MTTRHPPHDPRERVCALCGFSRRAHRACSSPSEQTSPSACAHAPLSRGPTTFPCYHLVEAREILTVQLCVNELTRDLSSDDLCMCVCDVCMCDGDVDRPRRGRGRFLTIPIYKCHWVDARAVAASSCPRSSAPLGLGPPARHTRDSHPGAIIIILIL